MKSTFILRTDASDTGIGAVLMQYHEETLFPVCYASRKLQDREKKYAIPEKECLAIIWAVNKFYSYIHGVEFILQTDHHSLQYLNKSKFYNARLMRWAMALQPFRMSIQYIKGRENVGADLLSRGDY